MTNIQGILENFDLYEQTIFNQSEHYNEKGRSTRKKILEISSQTEKGFFAEVGACMGTDTKILEHLGWNGILVEPSEGLFEFCKSTRKCIVENFALVSEDYKNETITSNRNFTQFAENGQINVFSINHYLPNYPQNSVNFKVITFSELCKRHKIDKIDIFVLDVEGYELLS